MWSCPWWLRFYFSIKKRLRQAQPLKFYKNYFVLLNEHFLTRYIGFVAYGQFK